MIPTERPVWVDPLCMLNEAQVWYPHLWLQMIEEAAQRQYPPMNVHVADKEMVIKLALPGRVHDGLELSARGDLLVVKGRRRTRVKGKYLRRERLSGDFVRSVHLPSCVDPDGITARLSHGIVTITLPKAREAEIQQIPVRTCG